MNEKLFRELRDWGCGVEEALPRFLNDREFYGQCAVELASELRVGELRAALCKGDRAMAMDIAHDLKGFSGSLGLTPIYKETCRLLDLLRRNELTQAERCLLGVERPCREYIRIIQNL